MSYDFMFHVCIWRTFWINVEMYPNKVINSFIKYVATMFFFLVGVVECQFSCTSPGICPSHKPYCTTSGCVFECPKSAYINGTECVAECGNHLVFNKTCVDHCPSNMILRETPKLLGREIYIEKLCVTSCDYNEYIYNGTCVKACPSTHNYINDNNCSTGCLQVTPFISNLTVNGLSVHKCVKKCEYLIEGSFCTNVCDRKKYIFNSSCVDQCPASHSFLYNHYCEQTCPGMTVLFSNNTCLSRCPIYYPYVFNNRCVNRCPKKSPYVVSEQNRLYCLTKCPQIMFTHKLTCVEKCPYGTVTDNKMCRSECSKQRPYSCNVKSNNPCSVDIPEVAPKINYNVNAGYICLKSCPSDKKIYNFTCYDQCPAKLFLNGNECVDKCPPHNPHELKEYTPWTCIRYCKDKNSFFHDGGCTSNCPAPLIGYDGLCSHKCPDDFIWWYEECSERTDAVKRSAITFGIGMMLLVFGMNIVKEYFTFLYMALRMKTHQTHDEVVTYTNNTGELQGYVNIEMVQITDTD